MKNATPKSRNARANPLQVQSMSAVADALGSLFTSEAFAQLVVTVKADKFSDAQFRRIARMHVNALRAAKSDGAAGLRYAFSQDDLDRSCKLGLAVLLEHHLKFGVVP
jgi:hypothetical protein